MGATGGPAPRRLLLGAVAATVVAIDQLTKWWALERLSGGRIIEVFWTLRFRLTFNTGMAFSLAGGFAPWIAVLALGVVAFLVWHGRTVTTRTGAVALGLILGGAIGNLADRAFRGDAGFLGGAVVDFIDLQWWPVFNVADMGVVVGAVLLVASTLLVGGGDDARPVDRGPAASGGV
jgi:signal peptidase II